MSQMGIDVAADTGVFERANVAVSPVAFMKRLRRLLVLRYQAAQYLDARDIKLLDRSIFSTYCDLLGLDCDTEAQRLLHEARVTGGRIARHVT